MLSNEKHKSNSDKTLHATVRGFDAVGNVLVTVHYNNETGYFEAFSDKGRRIVLEDGGGCRWEKPKKSAKGILRFAIALFFYDRRLSGRK